MQMQLHFHKIATATNKVFELRMVVACKLMDDFYGRLQTTQCVQVP